MTDTGSAVLPRLRTVARPPRPSAFSNALVFGWRAVLKFKHVPEQLFDLVMTPIMFTLLFTFVFGGALAGSARDYLQFFLPGILVQTVCFNAVYSGMGLSTDLGKGLFDRFRSLPIWSLAPFAGLMVGDVLRHLIAGGDHPDHRPDPRLSARSRVFRRRRRLRAARRDRLRHGLDLHRPRPPDQDADDRDDARLHLPVSAVFASNIMVDPATMPGWLRAFVEVNPVSLMTDRHARPDGRRRHSWRHRAGARRAGGPDGDAGAGDVVALPAAVTAGRSAA